MADFTITVPDAVVPRIRDAFGTKEANGTITPATLDQVRAAVKEFMRRRVLEFEASEAALAKRAEVEDEQW